MWNFAYCICNLVNNLPAIVTLTEMSLAMALAFSLGAVTERVVLYRITPFPL
jgi:hypothetical protein